jgi:hypothetical protein
MTMTRPLALAVATTVTFCALYAVCSVAVALFPDGAIAFFNNWFHGIDLARLAPAGGRPMTVESFFAGLIGVVGVAFPAGALLGWIYDAARRQASE